jgi:hypothetical protein
LGDGGEHGGKGHISVWKYVVQLSAEKREHLQALIRKGKSPAKRESSIPFKLVEAGD